MEQKVMLRKIMRCDVKSMIAAHTEHSYVANTIKQTFINENYCWYSRAYYSVLLFYTLFVFALSLFLIIPHKS